MRIVILGNYLPRRCGIATFTANLTESILAADDANEVFVVAMNDGFNEHDYPEIVKHTISQQQQTDYDSAAKFINESKADICIVQHEFGIFGGESGVFVLGLLQQLNMPIVSTVHTVLRTPSYHERHIIKKMGELSHKILVMSNLATEFLTNIYEVPAHKIAVIHHGVPDFGAVRNAISKFSYPGKKVLGTFGFLGRSKGIETVINALPILVKEHPNVVYVVMGQTHPNVKKHCGEEYRDSLKNLAKTNNVSDHVIFEDGFFKEEDLKNFLLNVDIYITPYLNEAQITSGTLSYAVGAGACIVSTPFWHAKELLADGRGETFAFSDYNALGAKLSELLNSPQKILAFKKASFDYGKGMYWNKVGAAYSILLAKLVNQDVANEGTITQKKTRPLPSFSLDHIKRLTDPMGILEHANYSIPDYKEGYCLDDNARALILVLMAHDLDMDKSAITLADTYLRYIKLMQQEDGHFHNDMAFDKTFLDEKGSEDSFGRTIWAMGYLIRLATNDSHFQFAKDVFFKSFHHIEKLQSIRAISHTIIGLCHFLKRYPDNENVMYVMNSLTTKLVKQYNNERTEQWKWFEPVLCYDNAIIPLALWQVYGITRDKSLYQVAFETTTFLESETIVKNHMSLIGNDWYHKGGLRPSIGQQPIDAMAMVMMFSKAFEVTKELKYYNKMHTAFSWFLGNNDLLIPLFDEESKGCCDGLDARSVNRNQGAESTISFWLSYLTVWQTDMETASLNKLFE
ncbi:MAG: glycosyltransferase family 4 protein, partial [Flavobacteriaceae bacterium]